MDGKFFHAGKLCVPEGLEFRMIREHHAAVAHIVGKRLVGELERRYMFTATCDVVGLAKRVRETCLVCQACEPPTWPSQDAISMTPVPDRIFASVCLDVFSMPPAEWRSERFDCFLLCVDRLSGWMVARPTTKEGLTG